MLRIFTVLLILLIISCTETQEDPYKGWSPEDFYINAKEKSQSDVNAAIEILEQLQAYYPSSTYAMQAKLEIPYLLYKDNKYDEAILNLNEYIKLYPNNIATPYAYYLRGIASKEKTASFLDKIQLTDTSQRDVGSVKNTLNYYLALITKFPHSKYTRDAKKQLITLRNILAKHEFNIAIFYTRKESYIAAINRLKYIIEKFPGSIKTPSALHLMAYNYKKLNKNKLANDTKRVLELSYPKYIPYYKIK